MTIRSHREQHRGNEQAAHDEVELRVPRLEGAALDQAAHAGVRPREERGEDENEPRRDRRDAGELDADQQRDAEADEPQRARVFASRYWRCFANRSSWS